MGSSIDIEVAGDDEQTALEAVEQVFSSDDGDKSA
jgi:phosphotransferase system HPr-like phosphotransfer protein